MNHRTLKVLEDRFGKTQHFCLIPPGQLDQIDSCRGKQCVKITCANNVLRTFQEIGYDVDFRTSSNTKVAVENLPPTLLLKWNEYAVYNYKLTPTISYRRKRKKEKSTEKRREEVIQMAAHLLGIFVPCEGQQVFC